ncbi:Kinesin light chain [Nitrincola lacisaponensis]|uniref:Kinesin light chain n=1 Tax=Nitrincola lacisaponensis TaxID=267850 RepID=A0A063Y586_9GAMM|nr:tetratricopeptide repeat protein [Nitrincola lacisaponensis]KDE40844.1 Kinesin light chain [Nitrincola lacisaponensis]
MRQRHLSVLILSLLFLSLQPHASTTDWHAFQSQATEAYQHGDYQQAQQAIQQAIRVAEKADNGAAYQASSLNMLAYIYAAQGQTDQALAAMAQAVQLSRQTSGEHQEQLGQLLFNQGQLLQQAHQFEQARQAYQLSIEHYLTLMNTGEGKLWQAVLEQARMLTMEHQYAEVEKLIRNALAGFEEMDQYNPQPDSASDRADLLILLAQAQMAQQQYQQAMATWLQAKDLLQQMSPPNHAHMLQILESLNELALHYQMTGHPQQAESMYQQALDLLDQLNMSESIEQALILGNLASLKLSQKDNSAALTLLEQSLLLHDQLNQRPLEASQVASYTATLYYNQRQYTQAEPLFLKALALLDSIPAADEDSLLIALDNLAALYTAWGKPGEARPYSNRSRTVKDHTR